MKKVYFAIPLSLCLIFTSCATKPKAQDFNSNNYFENLEETEIEAQNLEESSDTLNAEDSDSEEPAQSDNQEDSQELSPDSTDNEEIEDKSSEQAQSSLISIEQFESLKDIEEPEVIDLEPEDELELDENSVIAEEQITEDLNPESTQADSVSLIESESDSKNLESETSLKNEITEEDDNKEEEVSQNENTVEAENPEDADIVVISEDDNSDSSDENSDSDLIEVSRSISVKLSEYIDISYPGNGWIFMGLTDGSKDIGYFGRKIGTKDTMFTVQARAAGKKILHFYKEDSITGDYIDDYIEIVVSGEKGNPKLHHEAPKWQRPVKKQNHNKADKKNKTENEDLAVVTSEDSEVENLTEKKSAKKTEKKNVKTESKIDNTKAKSSATAATKEQKTDEAAPVQSSQLQNREIIQNKTEQPLQVKNESEAASNNQINSQNNNLQNSNTAAEKTDAVSLLKEAKDFYNAKELSKALEKINLFMSISSDKRDEALFIKGQILEETGLLQNISEAINTYTTLTKNYPSSKYWDKANKRIIYLKRFYLQAR